MPRFLNLLSKDPLAILKDDSKISDYCLDAVKQYIDFVIKEQLGDETSLQGPIDEITIDGLDSNQVWLQTKLVLHNLEPDLMESIGKYRSEIGAVRDEPNESQNDTSEIEESAISGTNEMNHSDFEEEVVEDQSSEGEDRDSDDDESADESSFENPNDDAENRLIGPKTNQEEVGDIKGVESGNPLQTDVQGVNDNFFDLDEFNRQTLRAEENDDLADSDGEEVDFFVDMNSDDDEGAIYYDDFFDKPASRRSGLQEPKPLVSDEMEEVTDENMDEIVDTTKKDLFADEENEESDHGVNDIKDSSKLSTFQRQQLQIQKQITQLEKEAIADKKWALKGEVRAHDRPDDALLTEDLEFERTSKPVPVITSEITESLEDLIRRRIKEGNFDDLEKRVVSISAVPSKERNFELSDAKSSKSLAELYEDDYKGISKEEEVSETLKLAHDEIEGLYKGLVYQLDALASAHFIPKPVQKSLEVRSQSAAINMEDAQPLTMSAASTLAPQEVYATASRREENEISLKNGMILSKEELSREDKNRLRRAAKRKRSKTHADRGAKKSKKGDVLDTLAAAKNVTLIDRKGEKRDAKGNLKKDSSSKTGNYKL
ncbi:LAMI_0H09230g1_1 [Lachancea mirantina]|uniref:U3 small nucleolar ribonucleoprotein protein MPP10 n=1 Tax=Lachancea mirantina TaxID=1230905 RepID=A0A1G4KGD2_9SACH|nr:LAMI_0H09230g1_1 [Lachancea mirantina]